MAENRFRPHVTVGPYVESSRTAPSDNTGTAGLTSELTLRVKGQEAGAMDERELSALRNRSIGFVFQSYHLLPRLSAWEKVALFARLPRHDELVRPASGPFDEESI